MHQDAGLFEVDAVVADRIGGAGRVSVVFAGMENAGFAVLFQIIPLCRQGGFFIGNHPGGVQPVGKVILIVVKKYGAGAAGFPLFGQVDGRFVFGPVAQVGAGQVGEIVAALAEFAGVMPPVEQVEDVITAGMEKGDDIADPGVVALRREILNAFSRCARRRPRFGPDGRLPEFGAGDQRRIDAPFGGLLPPWEADWKIFVHQFAVGKYLPARAGELQRNLAYAVQPFQPGQRKTDAHFAPIRMRLGVKRQDGFQYRTTAVRQLIVDVILPPVFGILGRIGAGLPQPQDDGVRNFQQHRRSGRVGEGGGQLDGEPRFGRRGGEAGLRPVACQACGRRQNGGETIEQHH